MRTTALVGIGIVVFWAGLGAGYVVWGRAARSPAEQPATASPESEPAKSGGGADLQSSTPAAEGDAPRVNPVRRTDPPAALTAFVSHPREPEPCPACPSAEELCAFRDEAIQTLKEDNVRLRGHLTDARDRLRKTGPQRRYLEPTVQGRRSLAAEEDILLLEVPAWKDDISLRDEVKERLALDPGERAEMEGLYREFRMDLHFKLRDILVEMIGDPDAGEHATINSMIQDIVNLSPRGACREQMREITKALIAGAPLPPAGADAPVCELLVLALFAAVDSLDAEVRGTLGDAAADVIWGNTSTFEFGPLSGADGSALSP